jgi:hypothetical protein
MPVLSAPLPQLHFCFGFGAFIAPLLIGGSLDDIANVHALRTSFVVLALVILPFIALLVFRFPTPGSKSAAAAAFYADDARVLVRATAPTAIAAADDADADAAADSTQDGSAASASAQRPLSSRSSSELRVIFLAAAILFCDVGVEMSTAGFLAAFAVESPALRFAETSAANLVRACVFTSHAICHAGSDIGRGSAPVVIFNMCLHAMYHLLYHQVAIYWMFFTGSRFASIFVSIRVSSARMLGYAMTGVFLSILVCKPLLSVCAMPIFLDEQMSHDNCFL